LDYDDTRDKTQRYFLVKWANPRKNEAKTKWVPQSWIANMDSIKRDVQVITRWKESGVTTLSEFLKTRRARPYVLSRKAAGDDGADGHCGYVSVGVALMLVGLGNPVTPDLVKKFREEGKRRREGAQYTGVRWKALFAFVKSLNVNVDLDILNKNIHTGEASAKTKTARSKIESYGLSAGIYLVGGFSQGYVGHVFVVNVNEQGKIKQVYDNGRLTTPQYLDTWFKFISYIRCVQVQKL
jgi:hypothetical protein